MRSHKNNIGLLRLLFACLVIVSHSPQMIDGDGRREPLQRIFSNLSFGMVAVDGFFILSGYLITRSMLSKPAVWHFLSRRILRIYPAFILASLLCVFVLVPATGGWPFQGIAKAFVRIMALQPPGNYPGQLSGLPDNGRLYLNGPMWTIAYEFRCYLLTLVLGLAGILHRPRAVLLLFAVSLAGLVAGTFGVFSSLDSIVQYTPLQAAFGLPSQTVRLTAAYLFGMSYCLYQPRLPKVAIVGLLFVCLSSHLAEAALITFGGAVLFWLAFANIGPLQAINDRWDISYGVYLYGWPIGIYLYWLMPMLGPWQLTALTLPLAAAAGSLSWWGLEKWLKDLRLSFPSSRLESHAEVA